MSASTSSGPSRATPPKTDKPEAENVPKLLFQLAVPFLMAGGGMLYMNGLHDKCPDSSRCYARHATH